MSTGKQTTPERAPYPEPMEQECEAGEPENGPAKVGTEEKLDLARDAYKHGDIEASREAHAAHHAGHHEDHGTGVNEYVKSVVFGGLDGIITTFAVVAAAQGASADLDVAKTVLILGFANLFADGFSMGFGEYIGSRAELDYVISERKREEWEVANCPEMERAEMVDLYVEKGLERSDAETIVGIISKDPKVFVDIMMVEELGLIADEDDTWRPLKSAVVMFVSFVVFGMVPLLVYLPQEDDTYIFGICCAATALTLFVLGAVRGKLTRQHWLKCGLIMVGNGAIAAGISYLVGWVVSQSVGGGDSVE